MNDSKKKEDRYRTTLPAPGLKMPVQKIIGKLPPPPISLGVPLVEEPARVISKETETLKRKLTGRAPEINKTGIDYRDFVEGIKDARKIVNVELKTRGEAVFTLETKFGTYLLSSKPFGRLKDNYAAFINMTQDGDRMMVIPVGEQKKLYIEKIKKGEAEKKLAAKDELKLPIEIDLSQLPDYDLGKLLISEMTKDEVEIVINRMEQQKILDGYGLRYVESMEVIEDFVFDLVYLTVHTKEGGEYWIFIREDGATKRNFVVPEMSGTKEVNTGNRTYAVVTFFSEEPIDTSEIKIN